jgi:hypothetical protein
MGRGWNCNKFWRGYHLFSLSITKTDLNTEVADSTQHACQAAALCNRARTTKAIAVRILATITVVCSTVRDFRLQPRCKWGLCSSGMLRSLKWWLPTFRDGGVHHSCITAYMIIPGIRFGPLDPWRWERRVVPKRRSLNTITRFVPQFCCTVIPRLTKIICPGITFISRNVISRSFL